MKIKVNGNVNEYYVQTLSMLFFPGAKFSDKDTDDGGPHLYVDVRDDDTGVECDAEMTDGQKCAHGHYSCDWIVGETRQRVIKIAVGKAVFEAGKELFKLTPPWGILIGVRPTKVPMGYLLQGHGIRETQNILKNEYFLNAKKAQLVTGIASYEMKLTKKMTGKYCSVYISIPFCPSRCAYCSFVSYTSKRLLSLLDEYLVQLKKEISEIFKVISEKGYKVATIYIGGGTPTILDECQLADLLSHIEKCTDVSTLMEYTLEAGRPDTITEEKLAVAKQYGVTRISVNPQSLSDVVLEAIGRKHNAQQFFSAYEIARKSGIRDINIDLIAGLPMDNFIRFSRTVDKIAELDPENITIHTFSVKKASDILRQSNDIYTLGTGMAAKCIDYSQVKMRNSGYKPYYMYRQKNTVENLENVGYAKEGHEGLYNIFMMEEYHTIFAAGAGAVTKLVDYNTPSNGGCRIKRIFNPKYPYEYLRGAEQLEKKYRELSAIHDEFYSERDILV